MLIPFKKENVRVGMFLAYNSDYYIYKIKEMVGDEMADVIPVGRLVNGVLLERKTWRVMKNIDINVFREVYIPGVEMK